MRKEITENSKWEREFGYCRAVRIDNRIEVSGTTSIENGKVKYPNDFYKQTDFILRKINRIIEIEGFTIQNVVRTRIFTTDITKWAEIGRAHERWFRESRPASSLLGINSLMDPNLVVEIELTIEK